MIPVAALGALGGAEGGLGGLMGTLAKASAGFNQLAFAANMVTGKFNEIVQKANKYTEAINPALIQNLNLAFRDLNAVLGLMAQEITQAAIPVVRAFSDTLLPVMRQLQPVMHQMAEAVGQVLRTAIVPFGNILRAVLIPYMKIWGDLFQQMAQPFQLVGEQLGTLVKAVAPLIDAFASVGGIILTVLGGAIQQILGTLAPIIGLVTINLSILANLVKTNIGILMAMFAPFINVLKGLGAIATDFGRVMNVLVSVVVAVMEAISNSILALFASGGGMKDTMKNLQDSFRNLAKAVLLTVAQIMKAIGFTSGLQAMIQAIEGKKEDATGFAVAQNPAFKALDQLGKDVSLQAFAASAQGATEKKTDDFLRDILGELKEVAASDKVPEIMNILNDLPDKLASALVTALAGQASTYTPSPIGVATISPGLGAAMWIGKKLRGG